ncbi:MAG: type II toxin-antitoxin system RelE/ParE family toxin [Gammaproteobacteria bacterium]|nr:type II toxin-antitoxin system RelE/ParE family toxin [Gammaproteobacteria bacterium]
MEKLLAKLPANIEKRILKKLDAVLALKNPRSIGDSLSGPLHGLWRYRVGDYRIICDIQEDKVVVLVLNIGHRREIYKH